MAPTMPLTLFVDDTCPKCCNSIMQSIIEPHPRQRTSWRSDNLRGALPLKVTRALEIAVENLPGNTPWPDIDEDSWWRDVLSDARVRTPTMKNLPLNGWRSKFRLDRLQCSAMTFTCAGCKKKRTVSVADLIKRFETHRNATTIGNDVLECPDKRSRREGYDCPVSRVEVTK
jgi:hypothetical protein